MAGVNNKNKKCKQYDVNIQDGHNETPTVLLWCFYFAIIGGRGGILTTTINSFVCTADI